LPDRQVSWVKPPHPWWAALNKDVKVLPGDEGSLLDGSVHAGPVRVLLVSSDYDTARLIEDLLRAGDQRAHLVTYATWDAAAAQAVLDHPSCCVLLDASKEDTMALLEYVRMSAPQVPIVLLAGEEDERLELRAVRDGAQDCLVMPTLDGVGLRRALAHAIERKRAEAQLAHQALHDQLTALPNRALFLDRLGVALERARRSGAQLAVLFLDFDNFKQINDSRGHGVGDQVLAVIGERLSGLLRPMDTVARFGGDEFTFLFEDLTSEREVVLIADRICEAARQPIHIGGVELSVTVSVGIAIVADPTVSPETVLREADAAMYRAKDQGRSRYELFDEDSRQRAIERIELEAAIREAIERGELRVHYQPSLVLHDDDSHDASGVEALVRWQHPTRGLIAAREFMPIAEDIGLVIPIGRFVLEHALDRLARWRTRRPDITLSLNLSPRQLHDPNLPDSLLAALEARDLDPAAICLEIPERAVAEDPDTAIDALERLKATGVRIALDDFGSGASSLSRLRELPVDELKLHESFIAPLGCEPEDASLVGALVDLGHALGLAVVAEGVEHESQIEQLRELGCDAAQGYAIGRPVSEDQLEAAMVSGLMPAA
jgi:diguanylate cyclase (GGDEF)-like protein